MTMGTNRSGNLISYTTGQRTMESCTNSHLRTRQPGRARTFPGTRAPPPPMTAIDGGAGH